MDGPILADASAPSAPKEIGLPGAVARFFGASSPRLIALKAALALAWRLAVADFSSWDLLILGAVAVGWPVQEWVLHRFVLHQKPREVLGRRVDFFFARKHRDHHRHPWHLADVFLPLRVLLPVMVLNVALWALAMPRLGLALTGIFSVSVAALLYEWTHFLTHTGYKPRSRYYAKICLSHRRHHFKSEHFWYGFTVPAVDWALRTDPDHRTVETSPTCRTLGVDDPS